MIFFNTIFKIDAAEKTLEDIFCICKKWISGSRNSSFSKQCLADFQLKDRNLRQKKDESVEIIYYKDIEDEEHFGFRYTKNDNKTRNQWTSTITASKINTDFHVSIKLEVNNSEARPAITYGKKPVIVKQIIRDFGIAYDGHLIIGSKAVEIDPDSDSELGIVENLMGGCGENQLPVVYISWPSPLADYEIQELSEQLEGMAHVIVEPNEDFSKKISPLAHNRNPYNGAIGIYWKGGYYSRVITDNTKRVEILSKVVKQISDSLITMNTPEKLKWNYILEKTLSSKIYDLRQKQKTSEEYDELMQLVDEENSRLKSERHELEEKIRYLQERLDREEKKQTKNTEINHNEDNLFDEEIKIKILLSLKNTLETNDALNLRSKHIFEDVLSKNKSTLDYFEEKLSGLQKSLIGYEKINRRIEESLEYFNIKLTPDEGKHHKAKNKNDSRYSTSFAKTASDHRAGENIFRDLKKNLISPF
jgi:hypothetical protein